MVIEQKALIPEVPLALWRLYLEPQAGTNSMPAAEDGYSGVLTHGWIFRQLADLSPEFSSQVHDTVPKAFTVSGLRRPPANMAMTPGTRLVEITAWGGLTPVLMDLVVRRAPVLLTLGSAGWRIVGRERHLTLGPFVAEAAAELGSSIDITVQTPLSFRRTGQQWPFPVPDLWLSNLAQRLAWKEFVVPSTLRVSWFQGGTRNIHLGKFELHGFVGGVGWDLSNLDLKSQLQVRWLLTVGQYIGVGYKTAMGLGRYRIRSDRRYVRPGQTKPD